MKYKIILCLLFTIINSKKEFISKLGIANDFSRNNDVPNLGVTNVCDAHFEDECLAIENPKQDLQCCFTEISAFNRVLTRKCEQFPKDISAFENITNTDQYKAAMNEAYSYKIYNQYTTPFEIEDNITCSNGKINMIIDAKEYSEDEQKILKNEKHCLKKKELKEEDIKYDVGNCEEGLIVDSSKNVGLEC